ncbi:MAG TPA: hypothetical protein VIW29_21560 [Polyangiaceae bacterium]
MKAPPHRAAAARSRKPAKAAPKGRVVTKAAPPVTGKSLPLKATAKAIKPEPKKPLSPEIKKALKPELKKPEPKKPELKQATASKASPKAAEAAKPSASEAPPRKPTRKSIKEAAGVSSEAVMRRTGKSWDDWFDVLDTAGAATLDQRGVIAILAQKHGIGPWWQQMIAVGYESLRTKSDKPPAADGFRINSSCTLDAPLPRVFRLWNDAGERARWLADDRFVVRGTTADKLIRARWGKGTSQVAISFTEKSGRTEVSVEHHQIETQGAADQMKAYWAKKLGLLDRALAARTR